MSKITIQRTVIKNITDEKGKEIKITTKPDLVVSHTQIPTHKDFQSQDGFWKSLLQRVYNRLLCVGGLY